MTSHPVLFPLMALLWWADLTLIAATVIALRRGSYFYDVLAELPAAFRWLLLSPHPVAIRAYTVCFSMLIGAVLLLVITS